MRCDNSYSSRQISRVHRHGLPWLSALALLLPAPALAGGSGWTDYTGIAELTPTSHHRYTVRLNLSDNPSGCRRNDTFYQDYSASGAQQMFQTLLEAVASGKRVRVFVTGRCELNGYAEISSVSIQP
ncbi:MAG: hypothetical protein P8103_11555 [Candidatus Thiodiazotropha sp.]